VLKFFGETLMAAIFRRIAIVFSSDVVGSYDDILVKSADRERRGDDVSGRMT
jgi:hypothetical protein